MEKNLQSLSPLDSTEDRRKGEPESKLFYINRSKGRRRTRSAPRLILDRNNKRKYRPETVTQVDTVVNTPPKDPTLSLGARKKVQGPS